MEDDHGTLMQIRDRLSAHPHDAQASVDVVGILRRAGFRLINPETRDLYPDPVECFTTVIDTVCDGLVPSCTNGEGLFVVYRTREAAEAEVADCFKMQKEAWEEDPDRDEDCEPTEPDEGVESVLVIDGSSFQFRGLVYLCVVCDS